MTVWRQFRITHLYLNETGIMNMGKTSGDKKMPKFKDDTAAGGEFDRDVNLENRKYSVVDYYPRLDISDNKIIEDGSLSEDNCGKTFKINGFDAGWDRFNKKFRPIERSSETSIGWDWVKSPDWKKFDDTSNVGPVSLRELVKEHHRLRDLQNKETAEGSKILTTGLFDLMKWTGWKYRNTSSFRVYLSNQNPKIIEIYNKSCGKPDPGGKLGAFGKDFTQREQDHYLLKGLNVLSYYRKPRANTNKDVGISANDESLIFDFLFN